MSETEEQDFIAHYVTWMKGTGHDVESLNVYNFGYDRPLPLHSSSISLSPDTKLSFNLQTSGIHTQSRSSIAVVGEKYVGKFEEIMFITHKNTEQNRRESKMLFCHWLTVRTPTTAIGPH